MTPQPHPAPGAPPRLRPPSIRLRWNPRVPWRHWVRLLPLALLVLVALTSPWLAPHPPEALVGPALAPPSATHPLGTTSLGQDVASRVLVGSRSSLAMAALVAALSIPLGVALALVGGLVGGWVDALVGHLITLALALPRLPFLIVIGALSPPGLLTMAVTLSAVSWAPVARVLRARVHTLRAAPYLTIAAGLGHSRAHLARHHLLPELGPLVAVEALLVASNAVLAQATLAFLGLGVPTDISWGGDLHRVLTEPGVLLTGAWMWWALPCGLAVSVLVGACMAAASAVEANDARARGVS